MCFICNKPVEVRDLDSVMEDGRGGLVHENCLARFGLDFIMLEPCYICDLPVCSDFFIKDHEFYCHQCFMEILNKY